MADVDMGRFDLALDPSPRDKPLRSATDDVQIEEQMARMRIGQQSVCPNDQGAPVKMKLTEVFSTSLSIHDYLCLHISNTTRIPLLKT